MILKIRGLRIAPYDNYLLVFEDNEVVSTNNAKSSF